MNTQRLILDENNVCTSIKGIEPTSSTDMLPKSTMMLAALATVLVIMIVIKESRKAKSSPSAVGQKKPRVTLGSKNKNSLRKEPRGCDRVSIDSPDFERCATLGAGRTVLPGNPARTSHNLNTEFVQDNFEPVGNPFAMKLDDSFVKEDFLGGAKIDTDAKISRAGGQAFPFSQKGTITDGVQPEGSPASTIGGLILGKPIDPKEGSKFVPLPSKKVPAPPRSTARSSLALGAGSSSAEEGVKFDTAFLGTAVSPSAGDALGVSQEEIIQSAQQIDDVNVVQRTHGGQLNLLVHS